MTTAPTPMQHYVDPLSDLAQRARQFVRRGLELSEQPPAPRADRVWSRLRQVETELWLDSGDSDAIEPLWNDQFSGLTTNNTLLNAEVQKGIYDGLIAEANALLSGLDRQTRIREIGFLLNMRYALRLVERFRCPVSVELHTDVAHDTAASIAYARRCHEVCPEFFVVKVPFTPAGLIAIRQLRDEQIQVNCTLGLSARQNYVATALASPSYVNVFLGRLNAYVADNDLGDGKLVGEKASIASQHEVSTFTRGLPNTQTRQIAASVRDASQLPDLAGIDVITMPPRVAAQAVAELNEPWQSRLNDPYPISLNEASETERPLLDKLWTVDKQERNFVQKMILSPAQSAADLIAAARAHECLDLFPEFTDEEQQQLAADGKVPSHQRWRSRLANHDLGIDSLLSAAGLAAFAADQAALDRRIGDQISD